MKADSPCLPGDLESDEGILAEFHTSHSQIFIFCQSWNEFPIPRSFLLENRGPWGPDCPNGRSTGTAGPDESPKGLFTPMNRHQGLSWNCGTLGFDGS